MRQKAWRGKVYARGVSGGGGGGGWGFREMGEGVSA